MIDEIIKSAVYNLCVQANTILPDNIFAKIEKAYTTEPNEEIKQALQLILKNAKMSYEKKMPLCQDTGQVLIFISGPAKSIPNNIKELVNAAVEKAYQENYFRKSVVKDALFDRTNSKTNTPSIIYTEITDSEELKIEVLLKGAGSENMSQTQMLSPTASEDEIADFVLSAVKKAGAKACPPYFIGVGIGGTMEYAGLLSKKALLLTENIDKQHTKLADKIISKINNLKIGPFGLGGENTALDLKILTDFTHIACMPVAVTINCHSSRHAKCTIKDGEITYFNQTLVKNYKDIDLDFSTIERINTSEIDKLRALKPGQKVLLSGEIYTARDMAHKRLVEMIEKGEKLPFDIKDKVIFYAGPCPCTQGEVVGSIGPTTSSRMDKFATVLYQNGLLATIGKGERSESIKKTVSDVNGLYFTVFGGIACYLSESFIKRELVAFEDLGTEAIFRFEAKDMLVRLELS